MGDTQYELKKFLKYVFDHLNVDCRECPLRNEFGQCSGRDGNDCHEAIARYCCNNVKKEVLEIINDSIE